MNHPPKSTAVATDAATPSAEAAVLIEQLRSQASTLLSAALGQNPLVSFGVGSAGNFPYYWQNPSNLLFNGNTYNWINYNLKANATPTQQSSDFFTTQFIEVFSSINYQLSQADQATLTQAQKNATNQQMALLTAWKAAYGSLPTPTPGMQPIDIIMNTIATTWAKPATTLSAIQMAPNLNALLNNTPASGQPIRPVLANYLQALGSSISLQNATTMNNGYLQAALTAVQSPSATNGGLTIDTISNLVPAYNVATPLSDIINGLNATSNAIPVSMGVARTSASELQVSVSGSTGFSIPILDFFSLSTDASASYFSDSIATSSNSITIGMLFTGVTLVNFGPVSFNPATGLNWLWLQPITDAIRNGKADVTGFHFSPACSVDFSPNGPFGYLSGVAISNYPTVTITVKSANYQSIATTIQQSVTVKASFLGIPLGSTTESSYSHSVQTDASNSTVTITLAPPTASVAGSNESSLGWVLGAQTCYPAAITAFAAEHARAMKSARPSHAVPVASE
ncbi:hypothetical protein [Hymenobacter sp. BRD67]|uniref:hypothetical protein n=1 Tax=Hymenobacter sp. BRD67 TaxID=2675877 RepID=UPI001597DF92|nr:hypothetical protein [Hymenobacter sp. BRD67]QKG52411.1 lamin tail domain-containing protein [Hymenobacter sp. BRD67]